MSQIPSFLHSLCDANEHVEEFPIDYPEFSVKEIAIKEILRQSQMINQTTNCLGKKNVTEDWHIGSNCISFFHDKLPSR